MSLERIVSFTVDAAVFALPIGILFLLFRFLWKSGKGDWRREGSLALFVTYLAALLKITAIRQTDVTVLLQSHSMDTVQPIPLFYTLKELENGLWAFVYPVMGNLIWFVPLGFFLGLFCKEIGWKRTFWISAGLSLCIELCQWLLQTGVSDIDDVIFNSLGGLLGWWLCVALWPKLCYAVKNTKR